MAIRIETVSVDAKDPQTLGAFWAAVLQWDVRIDEDGDVWVEPGRDHVDHGRVRPLLFLAVPEHKEAKNRLHLDLMPDDQDVEIARVLALGATRADVGQSGNETWVVLADPEGNEFCVLSGE